PSVGGGGAAPPPRPPPPRSFAVGFGGGGGGGGGGTLPAVLNAANEAAVGLFLQERIAFLDIPRLLEQVCEQHQLVAEPSLEAILAADAWARQQVQRLAQQTRAQLVV
ncbi:MAG: hypothetical protein Q6J68_06480, partial [Thermostichales cyanobacterium SZTDM-1c_bins_54]